MKTYIDYLDSLSKKQLMVLLARQRHQQTEGIAIVGMGCRFPGGIDHPEDFWQALRDGKMVPASQEPPSFSNNEPRWNFKADDLAVIADKTTPARYLSNIDVFDAGYFGYTQEEAENMDPQQRLLLETTVQAIADANTTRNQLQKKSVGIFIGASFIEYPLAILRNGVDKVSISPHLLNGSSLSAASGRLGYMLGVSGPAMTIDTASSSCLTAVHLALQSLRNRECDIAIVGASHLQVSPTTNVILNNAGVLSSSGISFPFTEDADGFVRSEGCGIIVLKRAQDAKHDQPYAIIKGAAVHQHGDRLGLSVASANGQTSVIRRALENAQVSPDDVQYIEAQANGTRVGAQVEVEAIAEAYARKNLEEKPLYVGSCKANIGYLEVASGIAGIMKVALALAHNEIPPQPGIEKRDTKISWSNMALAFAREAMPWPDVESKMASISAFGVNGINGHVVLAAPDVNPKTTAEAQNDTARLLVASSHSHKSFIATAKRLADFIELHSCDYRQVCDTLVVGRENQKYRQAKIIFDQQELLETLTKWSRMSPEAYPAPTPNTGVAVSIPEFTQEALGVTIESHIVNEFPSLAARIDHHLEKMGLPNWDNLVTSPQSFFPASMMALTLAWIDLIDAIGLTITRIEIACEYHGSLFEVVRGAMKTEDVSEQWKSERKATELSFVAKPASGWTLSNRENKFLAEHRNYREEDAKIQILDIHWTRWLTLLKTQFLTREKVKLTALYENSGSFLRLPGPVLVGQRYWSKSMQWF